MVRPQIAQKGGNRRIFALLNEYGASHQNGTNKLIHWIAVPVIVWTIVALLWIIPVPESLNSVPYLNWATIALLLTIIYYAVLSWTLAIGMALFALLCIGVVQLYMSAPPFSLALWQFAIGAFVIAWIFQFIGHKIEGKKPSFFKDVQFLLIGPAWLISFLYRKLNIKI
ncbi:DUF962 domain-containing protein [Sneathiella litorea]|uniref:DUF962 domain-containing protein n=1 Tax=Sneathiella litorea TaxID=2606216 RepID=A0A6L8W260_9PROT|nr:Mpo1-like protein [Sneathiella litorea]MZR29096.1 DUF962 domain-containing protein [Sneathiella litorea]